MGDDKGKRRRAPERSAFGVLPTPWSLRMSGSSTGGGCGGSGACGPEAACRAFPNGTFACLCPHDASPPTEDLRCPNRRTVPMTPQPIRSIIPPSAANLTSTRSSVAAAPTPKKGVTSYGDIAAWGGTMAGLLVLLTVLVTIYWCKVRGSSRTRKGQSSAQPAPVSLSKGVLLADRYTSNPQYSPSLPVSVDPPVPIIPKESLIFLQEIGEGCFGKVYRGDSNSSVVAIKVLKDSASQEAEEDFLREVEIMSAFRHENILALIGVVIQENGQSPWMVFEFMPFGDLAEVLRNNSRELWKPVPGLTPLTKVCFTFKENDKIYLILLRGEKTKKVTQE
ncbi:hypothetical protein J437_LFUL015874 [Ladona fulva]|uniref:Protein kinase domain-containing protein n=1 Tax=Ladona fulva TaxID=123851 RepID=A0A8K0KJG9_LADFU|nr:hypothetical protein J437_LFUL015874 [Ladona fulva]